MTSNNSALPPLPLRPAAAAATAAAAAAATTTATANATAATSATAVGTPSVTPLSSSNRIPPSSRLPSLPLPFPSAGVLTLGYHHHTPPPSRLRHTPPGTPSAALPPKAAVGPFIIGVTGASASGKTTVCEKIIQGLGDQRCVLLSLDWFYHGLPPGVVPAAYNFDHPDAFDFVALRDTLAVMRTRRPVSVPMYDFARHCRVDENAAELDAADVIIVEGIMTFYDRGLREMMHMKVFVDEDADICLSRRIRRDVAARGRSVDSILRQYEQFVKPAFEEFILPTKRYADIVVPRGGDNLVAIDLIIKHIALKIRQEDLRKVFSNLVVMSDSYQSRGLHTIFRAASASRDDFVFYSNRLMRLLIEEGLGLLPFERKTVRTPTGALFYGVGFVTGLCGVSLMPAGEAMESSLRAVCHTVRIGKMLTSADGAAVRYEYLPARMRDKYVLVLAPVLESGAECETALHRLLSVHGCRSDRVMVLSLVVAPQAVARLCARFGGVRVVVSAIDAGLDEHGRVTPGVGDFGTRYYGSEVWRSDEASGEMWQGKAGVVDARARDER